MEREVLHPLPAQGASVERRWSAARLAHVFYDCIVLSASEWRGGAGRGGACYRGVWRTLRLALVAARPCARISSGVGHTEMRSTPAATCLQSLHRLGLFEPVRPCPRVRQPRLVHRHDFRRGGYSSHRQVPGCGAHLGARAAAVALQALDDSWLNVQRWGSQAVEQRGSRRVEATDADDPLGGRRQVGEEARE